MWFAFIIYLDKRLLRIFKRESFSDMNKREVSKNFPKKNKMSFGDVLRLIGHKLRQIIVTGIVFGIVVYLVVSFLGTPVYESRVSFYAVSSADSSSAANSTGTQADDGLASTYARILESTSMLDAVLNEVSSSGLSRESLYKMVNSSVVKNTQIFEVSVRSTNAETAYLVAQAFCDAAPAEIVRITRTEGVEVVDKPELAQKKAAPNELRDAIIAFFVGVIIAAIYFVKKKCSDKKIYGKNDIKAVADVPVLGQIPSIDCSSAELAEIISDRRAAERRPRT